MGCASLKQKVQPQEDQADQNMDSLVQIENTSIIPQGFIRNLQEHNHNIVKCSKTSIDQQGILMNSFQFFKLNQKHLWHITINQQYLRANIDLIMESIEGLLYVLPTYIKSNMTQTLSICQIFAAYAMIVFQFFVTNGKRYLKLETQSKYLNLISQIEQELQIERDNDQLLNNVEFELFQIKAAITLAPTDSKEGQEILTQFLGGALKASMTFTLNDDLLEAFKKGIMYIYNEYKKHQIKRKFELIYYITGLKYSIIQEIEKNSDRNKIYAILTEFQLKIIKDCVDWEIKCCWIKSISQIINHKILLKPQDFQQKLFQDGLQKKFILKIQQEYYANCNNSQILNDVDANIIFQQVEQLKLLSNIQRVLIQGNQKLQGFEDFYKIKMKFQSADSSLLIDKSTLNNIKAHIKNQSIQQKRITNEINNKENNNYLNALINEQLQEILLLDQDLHQLTQHKALLSTIMGEYDDSKNSADNQIAMTYFLIDILRTNNQELKDQSLENELSKVGISKEDQLNQKENLNIILKLEQQLKLITDGRVKTQITFKIIFDIFQVIDQYEKVINHNIEFLLKLQIQLDEVEGIEYCDYRGLEQIIKQLYQIMQQISSDKTFNIENVKQPSKILTQLKKQLIYQRHANIKLTKLSLFKSKNNQTQQMLKIQKSSCETIKRLIAGIKKVQQIIQDSQIKKEFNDSSIVKKIIKLLDEETLMNYNEEMVSQIKLMAINFKQYVSTIKEDQKQKSHINKIFEELQDIDILLTIISDFQIIPSKNEKHLLLLLRDLKTELEAYNHKQVIESKQTDQFEYKDEHVFFGEIVDKAQQLINAQQENLKILVKNLEFKNSVNNHYLNIKNLLKVGNKYSIIIQETQNEIEDQDKREISIQDSLKSELQHLQNLDILISSHNFQVYPKELESQIIFILKSTQNEITTTKLNLFDQFAVQIEDALNNSQWRIRQCIIFDLLQMQSNLLEPQVMAVNQTLLLKLQIYETDKRVKTLFQSPELIKQQTQLMEQYWPTIEEQVKKTIKEKLDLLNSIVFQIESEKQEQAKQRLQKKYLELQQEINEQLQNVSSVTSCLGITVLFLQDMKSDLNRIQVTLNQMQQAINEIGQDIKALRGKSFWDLLELRMKNVFLQMHIALAETIYIPIKTREKQIGNDKEDNEDNETNLFTEELFGDGEVNEFVWKETKDSMLIHGLAGSGKSTSSKKIEEFIWQIYEKAQNEADIVPLVPILIQLPTLKEPDRYAVEETLRSDTYRFNNKQIEEMKESVNLGKLQLVLIFDSYDEMKQQFIGINLYNSNKLEKWRKQKDQCYPKVITTSRTELFTSQNYHKWFISDKIEKYKEIRLIKFNDSQIQSYIEEFVSLSKKLTVKEFSEIPDSIEFEKQWKRDIFSEQDLQLRLENFVQKEKLLQTKQSLGLLWSAQEYRENMQKANLFILLETPFMMEIVMQVLPKIAEQFIQGQKKQQSEMFTTYNFYSVFLDQYFDRQIYKLQSKENFIDIKKQLWDFAQRLAIEMTMQNLSQVEFKSNNLVFKKEKTDWRDQFFNDDTETGKFKRLFRQCIPIRQKLGNYSFNHKSLQEFLVAKWFIDNIDVIEEQKYYCEINWSVCNVEWFGEILKFIESKTDRKILRDKLIQILKQTRKKEQLIKAGSNSIYILKKLGQNFYKDDLNQIKIKDVNLDNIHFTGCNLKNSNFENVNFTNVDLSSADLNQCVWQNLKLTEDKYFQFQNYSIDKIDIIKTDRIRFFNMVQGEIKTVNPQNQDQSVEIFSEKVIDYDYFDSENVVFLLDNCVKHRSVNQEYGQIHSDKWFLVNSSTKIIYINKQNSLVRYLLNGNYLLEIQIQFVLTKCRSDNFQALYYGYTGDFVEQIWHEYRAVGNEAFKTRVLIKETTELIAHGKDFILATHPGSLISLYNMKSDQIKIQNKQINQGKIVSIAINSEGQYIIGGSDCSLKCYQNDNESNIFFGHIGVVTILQFIEDNYFLSASQEDHSIRLWSIQNQQSLWKLVTSINITSFALNQAQKLILIGSAQGILQYKDFDFIELIKQKYKYHKTGIICCTLHDKILASGSKDNIIKIWDLDTGGQIGEDMIHGTPLCLVFQDSSNLYSGEQQGFIVHWHYKQIQHIYNNFGDPITHIRLSIQNKVYARSSNSIVIRVKFGNEDTVYINYLKQNKFDSKEIKRDHLENYQKAKDLPTFDETIDNQQVTQITTIINSVYSNYYAYGMVNGTLVVQHKFGLKIEQQIFEGFEIIELIELLNSQLICISQQEFKILQLNNESIKCLKSCIHKNNCCLAILKRNIIEQEQEQEQEILITVDDEEITLRNIKDVMIDSAENDNTTRFIKLNSKNKLKALAVQSGNNEILYGGTQQGTIQIWDTKKEQMIDEISLSKQPITRLIYLEKSNQLISSSEDGNVYFLQNNQIQEKLLQSEKLIKYMEVSEDERFIILAHQSNLTLWDIQEDKPNMIDSFGEFKDISALLVNFSHLYALIGDSNKLHKIPLSLRRILKNYAEELNYYPTCLSYIFNSFNEFITGDHLGRIGFWDNDLVRDRDFLQFEKQRINELVQKQDEFLDMLIISYDTKIVLADYKKRQILYEFQIKTEFVSCRQYKFYSNSQNIYYGVDQSLNCLKFDYKSVNNSKLMQITKAFDKFDKIISYREFLIIYSEQRHVIQKFTVKSKQFSVLEDNSKLEFKLQRTVIQDSIIRDQFGNDLNKLFLTCGAIDLSEKIEQEIQFDP